ncbi:MAG: rhodanese-like domain-containing protein [Chlorobiaceae bacterium]
MKKIVALVATALFFLTALTYAGTFDPKTLPEIKQTVSGKYLSAKDAFEMVSHNHDKILFLDVRTPAETEFVGIADQVDLNIPYMLQDYSTWDVKKNRFLMSPNSAFTMKVEDALKAKGLHHSDTIILICRSGDRSASAANLLTKIGCTNIYSVYDGFEGDLGKEGASKGRRLVNGWKNAGLPWGYTLNKERAYITE